MPESEAKNKLRGGYYTPPAVAEWLANWAVRSGSDRILEPSCGDGVFLKAAADKLRLHASTTVKGGGQIVGIELEASEAQKSKRATAGEAEVISGDFFDWLYDAEPGSFDVVLGNPPFVRYQSFAEPSRSLAMQFLKLRGLDANRLTNSWVPFVVGAAYLLRPGGRMAMVLPAELLQVSYAGQLRRFLANSFEHLTIFACNEMFFTHAEQEVVLLAADGKLRNASAKNKCDIALVEASTVCDLLNRPVNTLRDDGDIKFIEHGTEKWLKYFLTSREIGLMRALRENAAIANLKQHASVDVGIVTGKNEFFVLSRQEIDRYELRDFVVPLVGRSAHLEGAILNRADYRGLQQAGKRVYLLELNKHSESSFTPGLRRFIREGEKNGYHLGYKCSIRKPWYHVPAVWQPDCFFFRQIYDFPRVVVNSAKATSTDTIHRLHCRAPGITDHLAANLYTHLTAASAEIEGRSYGGGVLELEPTEAERLLVPSVLNGAMPISETDALVRQGKLKSVLEFNDRVVLEESLGLSKAECLVLKNIWSRMRERRRARRRR